MEIPGQFGLPQEIIEEILSWLPVKLLLKFRCVSKSWRILIDSKPFIKMHLERSAKNATSFHIILNSYSLRRIEHSPLHSLFNQTFTDSLTRADVENLGWEFGCIDLVGCCNGLVCVLLDGTRFVLWNPSTKMSKILPEIDTRDEEVQANIGFGCDDSSGDYKVFVAISLVCINGRNRALGYIYSLQSNSWKKISVVGDISVYNVLGKFASGKLHWEKREMRNSVLDFGIISLDLKCEVFGMVEQPSYRFSEGIFSRSLGVLGGCLCLLCDYQKTGFDVWVMKKDGVRESWDRVATLPRLLGLPKSPSARPFCICPNGEVVLTYLSNFVVYDPKTNGMRIINSVASRQVDFYTESLVSLIPDGEEELQTRGSVA